MNGSRRRNEIGNASRKFEAYDETLVSSIFLRLTDRGRRGDLPEKTMLVFVEVEQWRILKIEAPNVAVIIYLKLQLPVMKVVFDVSDYPIGLRFFFCGDA